MNIRENITKRKDGRYMGRFVIGYGENGKAAYQYVYGRTYEEAEKKLLIGREIESRFLSGRSVTIIMVYEEWIKGVSNRIKESTLANYKVKFEKHILPALGDSICSELNSGTINTFINSKLSEGLSASYVRDIFTVMKAMLTYAQEEYGFKLSLSNVVLPKIEKRQVCKIDAPEQKKLVEYIKANLDNTTLGILLSLFMGLRIGELCGLRWGDIDLDNKLLYIRRTVQRICCPNEGKKTKVIISAPKSETSHRTIPIPDFLIPYLDKLKGIDEHYVLSGSEKLVEPRTMQYRYKRILQAAEAGDHKFHQLRHTFATNCIERGFDAKTLSLVLGHSSVDISLNRYVHPNMERQHQLMSGLSSCLL